jgi:CubicO group peptidase (beta-lactamase class C family)
MPGACFRWAQPRCVAQRVDIVSASRQNLAVSCHRNLFWATLSSAVLALVSLATGASSAQADTSYRDQKQRLADIHIQPLVEDWSRISGAPGGVIALVDHDQILMLRGFGLSNTDTATAVDPATTLFQVGELVRPMTVTAVLRAMEQGLLSLDEDLSGRAELDFLELGSFGALTLEQLLLHTAGFDHRVIASRSGSASELLPLATYLRQRMPTRILPPGRISIPSSHGFALAGYILETVSERTFAQSLDALVFRPLKMASSVVDPMASVGEALATGYRTHGETLAEVEADFPQTVPASFLLTTAADMASWLQIVLGDGVIRGTPFLSSASIDRLLRPRFSHHDSLPGRTLAFKEGSEFSPAELYLADRGGGFSSVLIIMPQHRVGLFAAFNSELDLWNLVYPILDTFASRLPDQPASAFAASPTFADHLSGYWQDAAVSRTTAEKLLSLARQARLVQLQDGSILWQSRRYKPFGPNEFLEVDDEQLRFCLLGDPQHPRFAATESLVLERLPWYATKPVQTAAWILFATLFLTAGWPRPALPAELSGLDPSDTFSPRWPWTAARLAATLNFLFIAILAILAAGALRWKTPDLLHGISPVLYAVLGLPIAAGLFSLVATAGLAPAWKSPFWSRKQQWFLTLLIAGLLLFVPFLKSWNLFGFYL